MVFGNSKQSQDVSSSIKYDVREISIDDASEYKRIHSEALKSHPNAFARKFTKSLMRNRLRKFATKYRE